MNLGTMKTALQRYAGVDPSDPLVDWINAAMHELEDAYNWPFLEATTITPTVVSLDTVVVPADLLKITTAKIVSSAGVVVARKKLNYISRIEYEESDRYNNISPGEPCVYTLIGNNTMFVWPLPDKVYSVRLFYDKFLPDLVNDGDVPGVPSRYHYTIVEGAAVKALQAESEEDRASTARTTFEDSIDRHITKLGGSKQGGQFNTVRDSQGYGS